MHQYINSLLTPFTKRREKPRKTTPATAFSHSSPICFLELSHQVEPFLGIPDFGLVRLSKCANSSLLLKEVWVKNLTATMGLERKVWVLQIGLATFTPNRSSNILASLVEVNQAIKA